MVRIKLQDPHGITIPSNSFDINAELDNVVIQRDKLLLEGYMDGRSVSDRVLAWLDTDVFAWKILPWAINKYNIPCELWYKVCVWGPSQNQ